MSEKFPRVTCDELVRVLKNAGFVEKRQKGSHLTLWRESDKRRATVPVHPGREVPIGTLSGILRDTDISAEDFRSLLKK
ncbi:MAG: type II toxin-antitoxin system HicA family toxin [Anaerolineales bacterium]|nr:type II toxin-antitoxin system HicA family toxin [Anaerolineales bacterium]